jgi:very-short-patch-repair endonuclease
MTKTDSMRRLAARQHGLITRDQAEQCGLGRRAWYSAQRSGRLVPVAPRVAALPGAPASTEQRILAALLSAGRGAIASHRSAAHLWGVDGLAEAPVDVLFTDRHRSLALPGVRVHTPADAQDLRPIRRAGIPTTNPLRLLVDLGQVAPDAVPRALQRFLFDGTVSRSAVEEALRRHGRPGRHGVRALRAALARWDIDGRPPDSELELEMAALLASHDLPPAVFHARILGYEVDFAIPAARLVLECDGWEAHGRDPTQFERDRARDAALIAAGWVVLRFTWKQITRQPAWVASIIARALAAHSAA